MRLTWMAGAAVAVMLSEVGAGVMRAQGADWGDLEKNPYFARGSRIFVVKNAEPQVRLPCRIRSLSADRLVCSERSGKNQVEYRKEDVLAMIEPPYHEHLLSFWLKGMMPGVGLIVTGALLSGPWAIAALVVGSLVVYCVTMSVAWSNGDYTEHLLYFEPGKPIPDGLKY